MRRAFTLIELLCTIAIIAILAVLLLPVLERGLGRARRTVCLNNLRSIGVAFNAWAHDHSDFYPMQVPGNQGGTKEFADLTTVNPDLSFTHRHFQALSNELVLAKVLRCPADTRRFAADDFARLDNTNLSYWINLTASPARPGAPVAGDRNVRTTGRTEWTFVTFGTSDRVEFSAELHGHRGNVLFTDAHVELLEAAGLVRAFGNTNGLDTTLSLPRPAFPPTDSSTTPGTPGGGASTVQTQEGTTTTETGPAINPSPETKPNSPTKPESPISPAAPNIRGGVNRNPVGRGGVANPSDGIMTVVLLDGTKVSTNLPEAKAVLSNTNWTRTEVEPVRVDPIIEFLQQLTRKAADHTYLLLLLLLLVMIAFEVTRRWKGRHRRRRFR